MVARSVSIRLGVDGKADFKRDMAEAGASGTAAFGEIAASAEVASAATDRAAARQLATWKNMAAAAKASIVSQQSQSGFNQLLGVGQASGAGSAKDSAAVFEAEARAQDQLAARTLALKAAIDPTWAAQQKLNQSVASASELFAAGAITEAEHTAAIKLAKTTYADAAKALEHVGGASSVTTRELLVLTREASRGNFTRMAGSASILAGSLGLMKYILNPVTLSIVGFLAVVGGAAALVDGWDASQERINRTLQGTASASGATIGQVNALAEAQARASKIGVGAARDIVLAMASTGRVGLDNLAHATALTKDYADAVGEKLKPASAQLAQAFADPARGAVELNNKLHFLTGAELEQIKTLEDQGDRTGALKLLMDKLGPAVDGASKHISGLSGVMRGVSGWFSDAAENVGKFIAATLHLPSADAAIRLATLQGQRAQLLEQGPGRNAGAYQLALSKYNSEIAQASGQIAAGAARTAQAQLADTSNQLKLAASALNPTVERIKEIQDKQAQVRKALADPKLLAAAGLTPATADAAIAQGDKEIKQLKDKAEHRDKHAEALGREAASMEADASATIVLANAYLASDVAALQAEARRKAVTDATKKGIDVDAQAARQLQLNLAEQASGGAKAVSLLRDQTAGQRAVNDAIEAGTLPASQAQKGLQIEAELRPLITAQSIAEGSAKAALTKVIDAYRDSRAKANDEDARAAALQAEAAANDNLQLAKIKAALAGDTTGARELELARVQGLQDAQRAGAAPGSASERKFVAAKVSGAQADLDTSRADFLAGTSRQQSDSLEVLQRELQLVTQSQAVHDAEIAKLQLIQQMRDRGLDTTTATNKALVAQAGAEELVKAKLALVQSSWNELRSTGDQLIDDLGQGLDPAHWGDWASVGKSVLRDLALEFEKLALLNPLKNFLSGGSLPTLGSTGGLLGALFKGVGSLFGGGGGISAGPSDFLSVGYAGGTDDAPGGLAWVAENGPELINLPKGARVTPAGQTRQLLNGAGGQPIHATFSPIIDNRGADSAAVARLEALLAEMYRNFPAMVVKTVNDARGRGMLQAA